MCEIDDPVAHHILAKTIVEVCRGEIEQISDKYRFDQNLRRYLQRIKRKTALLIAASCQLGAVVAGAPEAVHKSCIGLAITLECLFKLQTIFLTLSEQKNNSASQQAAIYRKEM